MRDRQRLAFISGYMAVCMITCSSHAQDYPLKPIRVFSGSAGGAADYALRLIGQGLSAGVGQPVIVDNRGGIIDIRADMVIKSPPDGYTLIFTSAAMWLAPFLRNNVSFDPIRDFTPIVSTSMSPALLAVHPSLPARSVKELIALAKRQPGAINYSVGALNASSHLAGELFKSMSGINMTAVPYKGSGPQINAIISGEVQVTFSSAAAAAPHVKSSRLRALAVTSAQPSQLAPGLPTVAASGLPDYELVSIYGLMAPPNMQDALVNRLNREVVKVLAQPAIRQQFLDSGVETAGGTPQAFATAIKAEMSKLGGMIRSAGMRE